jgi:hypothetical protein
MRRPVDRTVSVDGGSEKLLTRIVYGDLLSTPEDTNHVGKVYRVYDGAGVATTTAFDFKGNALAQAVAYGDEWRLDLAKEDIVMDGMYMFGYTDVNGAQTRSETPIVPELQEYLDRAVLADVPASIEASQELGLLEADALTAISQKKGKR